MTKEEYKMIQEVLTRFEHKKLTNEGYNLVHDIKSELGVLYSTKLGYNNHCDISGYRYEDLLAVATLLKEKHITPEKLTTYMDYFQSGYDYCNKLTNEAFKKYLSETFIFKGGES